MTTTSTQTSARNERIREAKSRLDEHIKELADELQRGKSDRLVQMLECASRFHRYSWQNLMLAWSQCPHMTQIAGLRQWNALGRHVKPGQRGILIFAPMLLKPRDGDDSAGKRQRRGSNQRSAVNPQVLGSTDAERSTPENETDRDLIFRPVYVFDLSQTEGAELPAMLGATGEPGELLDALELVVASSGIRLEYVDEIASNPGAEGVSRNGHIQLRRDLLPADAVRVLAHELAHEKLHWHGERLDHAVRECEADATAFVVLRHFSMWADSADYLLLHDADHRVLLDRLERIRRTAAEIIDAIETRLRADEGESVVIPADEPAESLTA